MAITKRNPNTIHLAGPCSIINHHIFGVAATPGMIVELYNDTTAKWRPNASATEIQAVFVALEQDELNLGIDDAYAAGDLGKVGALQRGSEFLGIVPSGQNIAVAGLLQSNGDGKLKAATATTEAAGLGRFQAIDGTGGAVTADTRIRIRVI